ncbi:hypothetical protein T02_14908, partial [Trichinella nativa]
LSQSSRESSFRVALMSTYWCLLLSVRFQCDMTKISNCGLRHPMKLVPFATRVRMDVKAFPSRPSVPLLITNSQRRNSILFMTAMKYVCRCTSQHFVVHTMDYVIRKFLVAADGTLKFPTSQPMALSNCVSYVSDVFPCHARAVEIAVFLDVDVLVRSLREYANFYLPWGIA